MRLSSERAGVDPLVLVARRRRHRGREDLIARHLVREAVLEREVGEEVDVEADLGLLGEGRPEVPIAERHRRRAAADERVDLVLRLESRAETGRAVRRAELELVHAGQGHVLGEAVRRRDAVVQRRALILAEERRRVLTDEPVDDVAILDVERRDREDVLVADRDRLRPRANAGDVRGSELRDAWQRELLRRRGQTVVRLVFEHVRDLGRIGEPLEIPHRRERRADVARARRGRFLAQTTRAHVAVRRLEAARRERLVHVRRLLVVHVAFGREPRERLVRQLERAIEAVAVAAVRRVGEPVQRVHHVTRERRPVDLRHERRAARVRRQQIHIRLQEAKSEEDARVLTFVRRRAAVECAGREGQLVRERLVEIHAEVLAREAVEQTEHARLAAVVERDVEVRVAAALPDRGVVGHVVARTEHLPELVEVRRVRVVRDQVRLLHTLAVRVKAIATVRVELELMRLVAGHLVRQPALPVLVAEREVGLALGQLRSALREDLHHAIRRVGAVERARGRALDHFHALDVFRVDVGERQAGDRAVHDDQRIGRAGEARGRAEADRRRRTRLARDGHHRGTGHTAGQHAHWRRRRGFLDLRGIHHADREGRLLLRRRVTHAGHHDLLEVEHVLGELEVLVDAARGERHRRLLRRVADRTHPERHSTPGVLRDHDRESVPSIDSGRRANAQLGDADAGAAERLTRCRDTTGEDDVLREAHGGEQRHRGERTQRRLQDTGGDTRHCGPLCE